MKLYSPNSVSVVKKSKTCVETETKRAVLSPKCVCIISID